MYPYFPAVSNIPEVYDIDRGVCLHSSDFKVFVVFLSSLRHTRDLIRQLTANQKHLGGESLQ